MIFSKSELKENGLKRKDNGFGFIAHYKGFTYDLCGDNELDAYRSFITWIDEEDQLLRAELNNDV